MLDFSEISLEGSIVMVAWTQKAGDDAQVSVLSSDIVFNLMKSYQLCW